MLVLISPAVLSATITGQAGSQAQIQRNEEGDLVVSQTKVQERAENTEQVRAMAQERQQELEQEMAGKTGSEKTAIKNQNQVRLAVHSLLAMEDLVGGIGQQVSAIAREFDNSIQATINAEERIQRRNALARMFIGGDKEAGEEIEKEVKANKAKIQLLKQLKEQCECGSDIKEMFAQQVMNLEKEQTRLEGVAEKGMSRGLFGWLWK